MLFSQLFGDTSPTSSMHRTTEACGENDERLMVKESTHQRLEVHIKDIHDPCVKQDRCRETWPNYMYHEGRSFNDQCSLIRPEYIYRIHVYMYVQIFEVHNFHRLLFLNILREQFFADQEFGVYGVLIFRELNFRELLGSAKTAKITHLQNLNLYGSTVKPV